MSIETLLQDLITAVNANTAALKGTAPSTVTKDAAAAPKAAPAPAPAKPAAAPKAAPAPAAADISGEVRAKLKKLLDDKGAAEVRKVLGKVGAAKLSEVPEDKMEALMGHIKITLGEAEPEAGSEPDPFA